MSREFTINISSEPRDFEIVEGGDTRTFTIQEGVGRDGTDGAAGPNSVTSATTSDGTATLNTSTLTTGTLTVSTSGVFNATSYTFGTGAASAFKTALAITASNISDFNSAASSAAPVQSVAGRTGTITLSTSDISGFTAAASAAAPVQSVAGRTGTVTIASADITDATSAATANTVARRSSLGSIVFATCAAADFRVGTSPNFATYAGTNLSQSRAHQAPNADGTYCLTASTIGIPDALSNGTVSGTLTINSTTISYGTGAAAAHRTALGLTTLATTTPGTNVATFLATPTSANLLAAVTDETGTGSLVFGTSPTITTPTIAQINGNTTASGTLTLQSTTNATKGKILFGTSGYDEVSNRLGVGTNSPSDIFEIRAGNGATGFTGITGMTFWGYNSLYVTKGRAASNFDNTYFTQNASYNGTTWVNDSASRGTAAFTLETFSSTTGNVVFYAGGAGITGAPSTERMRIVGATGTVAIGTASPSTKAILDCSSTTLGFLPPRMTTTQRDAITSPPAGLMIYNTTTNKLNVYTTAWEVITSA